MGSGEADIHYLTVDVNTANTSGSKISTGTSYYSGYNWEFTPQWWISYPTTIYKYQVRCPKRGCKKFNWLELDTTTPCNNCGAKLRATQDIPEFTIPIQK